MMDPEPHANKIYNMVGEYQAGNQIVCYSAMKDERMGYGPMAVALSFSITYCHI